MDIAKTAVTEVGDLPEKDSSVTEEASQKTKPEPMKFDWQKVVASPAFWPGVALVLGITASFWSLVSYLVPLWTGDEYYTHGFLVPFISGYVVYRWWDRLKLIPVKPGYLGIPFLLGTLYLAYIANHFEIYSMLSVLFLFALAFSTWVIAGFRWMVALAAPIFYWIFALPLWSSLIDRYTMPLQQTSTSVAYQMLHMLGLNIYKDGATKIMLDHYTLVVAVACSGLKLVLALSAFAIFFMLIAKLKVWANIVFAACVLPLALFINGLRIALIGLVGNQYGEEAAAHFHDWSGYITLVICFIVLFQGAKALGWKD